MVSMSFETKEIKKIIETSWEKALDEGKKWFDKAKSNELIDKLTELRSTMMEKMGGEFTKVYDALGLVTREEFDALEKKVVNLSKKVNTLSKKIKQAENK